MSLDIDHNLIREFEARFGGRITNIVLGFFMAGVVAGALALIFAILNPIVSFVSDAFRWLAGAEPAISPETVLSLILSLAIGLFIYLVGYVIADRVLKKLVKQASDARVQAQRIFDQTQSVSEEAQKTQKTTMELFEQMKENSARFDETHKDMQRLEEAVKDLDRVHPDWRSKLDTPEAS